MPWRASEPRNSSCITSTSWSTRMSGRSTVALATAYSMIRSANSWRARSSALPLEPLADVGAQRVEVGEVAERREEVVVELGQDLLAQLARSTVKWAGLPASSAPA